MMSTQTQPAAAGADEPTAIVTDDKATELAALAWSDAEEDDDDLLDDDLFGDERSTTFWLRLYVGIIAAVVVVLGVTLGWLLGDRQEPEPAAAVAVPASSAPEVVLPSSPSATAPVPMPSSAPTPIAPPVAAAPTQATAPTQDEDDDQFVAIAVSVATRRGGYGTAGTVETARTIALNECKSHTGDDLCMVAESAHYGCVTYALDASGDFAGGKGPDPESARESALAQLPGANYVSVAECSK